MLAVRLDRQIHRRVDRIKNSDLGSGKLHFAPIAKVDAFKLKTFVDAADFKSRRFKRGGRLQCEFPEYR